MADRSYKRLETLRPGDKVADVNGTITTVIDVKRGSFNPYHTLYYFEDNIIIDEISKHRFYSVEDGYWKYLDFWKIGEHGVTSEGK
jgi:hypothetical protein